MPLRKILQAVDTECTLSLKKCPKFDRL